MKKICIAIGIIIILCIAASCAFFYATKSTRYSYAKDGKYIYILKTDTFLFGHVFNSLLYKINLNSLQIELRMKLPGQYTYIEVDDRYIYFASAEWAKQITNITRYYRIEKTSGFLLSDIEDMPDKYYRENSKSYSDLGELEAIDGVLFRGFSLHDDIGARCMYRMGYDGSPIGEVFIASGAGFGVKNNSLFMSYRIKGNDWRHMFYCKITDEFIDFPVPYNWREDYAVVNRSFFIINNDSIQKYNVKAGVSETFIVDSRLDYDKIAFSQNAVAIADKTLQRVYLYMLSNGSMISNYAFECGESMSIAGDVLFTIEEDATIHLLQLSSGEIVTYSL